MPRALPSPQPSCVIDYHPGMGEASGGLLGNWEVRFPDGTSLQAGAGAVREEIDRRQVPRKARTWTEAARKQYFVELRKRYPRRR